MDRNPYTRISDWWGEDLNSTSMRRLALAPKRHWHSFLADVRSGDEANPWGVAQIPPLPRGHLRPALLPSMLDSNPASTAQKAAMLLLYAHEVVVPDPLVRLSEQPKLTRNGINNTLRELVDFAPLVSTGATHFVPLWRFVNMTVPGWFGSDAIRRSLDLSLGGLQLFRYTNLPPTAAEAQSSMAHGWADPRDGWVTPSASGSTTSRSRISNEVSNAFELASVTPVSPMGLIPEQEVQVSLASAFSGAVHRLARNQAEAQVQEAILQMGGEGRTDGRLLGLQRLAELTIPRFTLDIDLLARARADSEQFDEWRQALASALRSIGDIQSNHHDWAEEASAIIHTELAPARNRLQASVKSSPSLAALREGASVLGLSALGGATGVAVGDSVLAGVTGALSAAAAEAARRYVESGRAPEELCNV